MRIRLARRDHPGHSCASEARESNHAVEHRSGIEGMDQDHRVEERETPQTNPQRCGSTQQRYRKQKRRDIVPAAEEEEYRDQPEHQRREEHQPRRDAGCPSFAVLTNRQDPKQQSDSVLYHSDHSDQLWDGYLRKDLTSTLKDAKLSVRSRMSSCMLSSRTSV